MKSLLTAAALLVFTSFAHAAVNDRSATGTTAGIVAIDGQPIPEIKSWSGGESRSAVVAQRSGTVGTAGKSLGALSYEPVVVEATPPFSPALQSLIAAFLGSPDTTALTPAKKTLLLARLDFQGAQVGETLQANGAFLSEIQFPTLDASNREPLRLKLVFRADSTVASNSPVPVAVTSPGSRDIALASNFQLSIDGLPTSRVHSIESFTLRREPIAQSSSTGTRHVPGELTVPNLLIAIGNTDAAPWKTWRSSFLPSDTASPSITPAQEKNGQLQFLRSDMSTSVISFHLSGMAPVCISTPSTPDGSLARIDAELYCESIAIASSPATATPATRPAALAKNLALAPVANRETAIKTAPASAASINTSPEDKGVRDPADFPRPTDVVRTSFTSKRDTSSLREIAYYSAKTKADTLIIFYEKSLAAAGWTETSRQEDNSGPQKTYAITSNWKNENRTAQLVLGDVTPDKTEIYVSILEKK